MTPRSGISEPVTTATDYALAVALMVLGCLLMRAGGVQVAWSAAFLVAGAAALLGGTLHGFGDRFSLSRREGLWRLTLLLTAAANALLLVAAAFGLSAGGTRGILLTIAAGKALVTRAAIARRAAFRALVIDSALSLGLIVAIAGHRWLAEGSVASGWIVAGALVSLLAGGVQGSGVRALRPLNHNDMYHLLQMLAAWLLYRGAVML